MPFSLLAHQSTILPLATAGLLGAGMARLSYILMDVLDDGVRRDQVGRTAPVASALVQDEMQPDQRIRSAYGCVKRLRLPECRLKVRLFLLRQATENNLALQLLDAPR